MAARRADAATRCSTGAVPGDHDSAPPSINLHELREALQVVIGSVDKLRDEILPDICGKLRSIESSTHAGAVSRASSHTDTAGSISRSTSKQFTYNKMKSFSQQGGHGENHVNGQAHELRSEVRSLHEHLEERMQAMYRQHATQWEERLQALLGEVRREAPPAYHSSFTRPSTSWTSGIVEVPNRTSRHQSPCIGQWRDLQGMFWCGATIVITEDGWHPVGPGRSELDVYAADHPIEFVSNSRCRLMLPADEVNSQGAPFDVKANNIDDTLIVTPMDDNQDGASYTLTRMVSRRRPMRIATSPDGQNGLRLLTPGLPPQARTLARRLASSVNMEGLRIESSAKLLLQNRKQGRLGFFLTKRYEVVQVVMIVLDAIVLAWRTQYAAESLASEPHESAVNGIKDDALLVFLNDLFCLWYTVDLVGRALAEGKFFFRSGVLFLHCFEVFIVVAYILEAIAVHADYDKGMKAPFRVWVGFVSFTRALRLLRIVHMSKLVRHHSAFRELRMMMYALQGAMKSLVCSLVMLILILLISGTVFTNAYLRHIVYYQQVPDGKELLDLENAFGTLFVSMFTLMKTVTGGTDWGEVYPLLEPLNWTYRFLYVLFQVFATLALLNVITAVFVESTMQRSTRDRESAVIDEISARRELLTRINTLFEEFDEDKDGEIKKDELKAHMQNRHIAAYFSSLGVDVDQVGKLFLLLDQDGSGTIDRQEFLDGCLRLKGDAKSVDLAVLQSDVDLIIQDMDELSELIRMSVEKIDFLLESRVAVQSRI